MERSGTATWPVPPRGSGRALRDAAEIQLRKQRDAAPNYASDSRVPVFVIHVLLDSWFPDSFWRKRFSWLHFSAVEAPMWRNGRRNGLKIRWAEQARVGSSPAIGKIQN